METLLFIIVLTILYYTYLNLLFNLLDSNITQRVKFTTKIKIFRRINTLLTIKINGEERHFYDPIYILNSYENDN